MNSTFTDASPDLLRAVVDHSLTPIYAARALRDEATGELLDFQIYFGNPAFCQRVRFSEADLRAQTLRTLFPTLGITGFFDRYRRVVDTGEPFEGEQEYPSPNGHFWYQVSVKKLDDGIVANFTDITERKQAERVNQHQTQLLSSIFNGSLNGQFAMRAERDERGIITDFTVVVANRIGAGLARQPVDAITDQPFSKVFPGYKSAGLFDQYVRTVESGQLQQTELYYPYDNIEAWYWVGSEPFGDGVVLTFLDITDRKQAELQLQETNRLLQTTLDASISSILAMTAIRNPDNGEIVDFKIDKANRSVERNLGKTPEELEGQTLLSVYPGNVESGFFALYVKAADTGEPQQATYLYTDMNGYEGWFEASAVWQSPGKIVLTFMNVTEHKQNEQLIQQQADLVSSVLNATMNTVTTCQAIHDETNQVVDFRFTLANQAALDVVNMTADELYTKTILEVSPELRNSDAFDQYVAVVKAGQPITMERHWQGRWFLAIAVRFGDDGMLISSIDITASKQAQLQIEQLNEQLKRSNESLDQFASVASHDLQEPLRKIKSFGDLLADQYGPQLGDGLVMLQRMQTAAIRMQTLIRDLLAYARLSKGTGPSSGQTARKPVNLNELVGDVLQDLEVAVAEKGALVEVDELPTLPGDALQLRQVFQNLLANALKFSPPGRVPRITLHCERIGAHQVPAGSGVRTNSPNGYYAISVADNGIGFSGKYREQIFGAFERLHTKSSAYGGSGIGLAIVRRVMDNHQGAVVAHSTEGAGATFTLYFPVSQ